MKYRHTVLSRVALTSAVVLCSSGILPCSGNELFSGIVTDPSGNPISGVNVLIYPAQNGPGNGKAIGQTTATVGSNIISATTSATGTFAVSLPSDGQYFVCTKGAPTPLLDQCSNGQFPTVGVGANSAGYPSKITLSKGAPIVVSVNDLAGRLAEAKLEVTLIVDSGYAAKLALSNISATAATFTFTVPLHSKGRAMLRSSVPSFQNSVGIPISLGVPDGNLRWAADTSPQLAITAQ